MPLAIPVAILIPYQVKAEQVLFWTQKRGGIDSLAGRWEFPGGKLEVSETPEAAVVREVWEETGVQVEESRLERLGEFSFKSVVIVAFLYHDMGQEFSSPGYRTRQYYQQNLQHVPPNNATIFDAIAKRFQ